MNSNEMEREKTFLSLLLSLTGAMSAHLLSYISFHSGVT